MKEMEYDDEVTELHIIALSERPTLRIPNETGEEILAMHREGQKFHANHQVNGPSPDAIADILRTFLLKEGLVLCKALDTKYGLNDMEEFTTLRDMGTLVKDALSSV